MIRLMPHRPTCCLSIPRAYNLVHACLQPALTSEDRFDPAKVQDWRDMTIHNSPGRVSRKQQYPECRFRCLSRWVLVKWVVVHS